MAPTTMNSPASGNPAAMKSTSGIGPATMRFATAESAARAGLSTVESITWAEPVAVSTSAHARCIVHPRTPCVDIIPEVMVIASAEIKRRLIRNKRRVESPSERTVENPIARDELVATEPWIPIPTGTNPTLSIPAVPASCKVATRCIHVCFSHIRGSQTAPPVQVVGLVVFLIELLRFAHRDIQIQLVSTLHLHVLAFRLHHGLPIEHAKLGVAGVKIIQPRFLKLNCCSILLNQKIILGMDLRDLNDHFAFFDRELCIRQIRRNHLNRAVVANPHKYSRCQQDFRPPALSCQDLIGTQHGRTCGISPDEFVTNRNLPFHIINSSWIRGPSLRRCISHRRHGEHRREQQNTCCL